MVPHCQVKSERVCISRTSFDWMRSADEEDDRVLKSETQPQGLDIAMLVELGAINRAPDTSAAMCQSVSRRHQLMFDGEGGGVAAACKAQLFQNVADVVASGFLADNE